MNQEIIGKKILKIRQKNNLTQKEFGDILGVTSQAVSKWENGRGLPDIEILNMISQQFNIDLEELINDRKKKKTLIYIVIVTIIIIGTTSIIFLATREKYQFATVTSNNENFKITGVVAYNKAQKSIYISNIEYIGENDLEGKYSIVECTLYEEFNDTIKKISKCSNEANNNQFEHLSTLLKNIEINVNDYNSMCNKFNKHNLYLLINGKDTNDNDISYKIPLKFNDKCSD